MNSDIYKMMVRNLQEFIRNQKDDEKELDVFNAAFVLSKALAKPQEDIILDLLFKED